MNSLIVSAPESAAWIAGSKTSFVVPVKGGISGRATEIVPCTNWKGYDYVARFQYMNDLPLERYEVTDMYKSPYALNKPIYLREPWLDTSTEDGIPTGEFIYKSDFTEDDPLTYYDHEKDEEIIMPFYSPATMPRSAARTWITPVKCEVVRCVDVSEEQMEQIVESKGVPTGGDDEFVYYRNYLAGTDEADFPWFPETGGGLLKSWKSYITAKHGSSFWDANGWLFYYEAKLNEK